MVGTEFWWNAAEMWFDTTIDRETSPSAILIACP
jgi:hypothetical protein